MEFNSAFKGLITSIISTYCDVIGQAIFLNNQPETQFFFMYVYFYSTHVSGSHAPIIRRINCINTTSGICVTVYRWPFGVQVWMRPAHQKVNYTEWHTRCRIDTINSLDDGHMAARNMWRTEINIHEKELCVELVIYKDYTEMYGQ
jgi:hypothetical protein